MPAELVALMVSDTKPDADAEVVVVVDPAEVLRLVIVAENISEMYSAPPAVTDIVRLIVPLLFVCQLVSAGFWFTWAENDAEATLGTV